jgi:MFS family permease
LLALSSPSPRSLWCRFMVSLDLSVVNVGLPEIASGLGFGEVGLISVIHAYALTFGGLLLLGGKIADRYGHKRILTIGLPVFGLACLLGGFAQEPGQLVARVPHRVSGPQRWPC